MRLEMRDYWTGLEEEEEEEEEEEAEAFSICWRRSRTRAVPTAADKSKCTGEVNDLCILSYPLTYRTDAGLRTRMIDRGGEVMD